MYAKLSKIQPHSISLGQDSLDFIRSQENEFFERMPIYIGKMPRDRYVSINGDHRIYDFSTRKKRYPNIVIFDLATEDGLLGLARYQRERFVRKNQDQRIARHLNELGDVRPYRLENIEKVIEFVRSEGVYRPADLKNRIHSTKEESELEYEHLFASYYDSE